MNVNVYMKNVLSELDGSNCNEAKLIEQRKLSKTPAIFCTNSGDHWCKKY